jgi:hypothetical protein
MKLKIADDTSLQKGRRFVQSAGLIFYGLAAQGLLTAAVGWYLYFDVESRGDLLLPATGALLAVCYAFVGYQLRRQRLWARNFAFAFAGISLFAFPVGTILGAGIALCLDRGNRAGVFPRQRRPVPAVPAGLAVAAEESAPPRRLEPSLALPGEQAG